MTYPSQAKYLLLIKESAWGTPITPTKDCGLIVEDVSHGFDREIKESMGISSPAVQKITTGIVDPNLSLSGDFQHGRLLEFVLGTVVHAQSGATTDWSHTFTLATNAPSATIQTGNDLTTDTVLTGAGMLVESAEFGIALNENLRMSCDFKGKTEASTSTAGTAVLSTLPVYPHALCTVKINTVASTECQNASITIKKVVSRAGGISSNLYQQGHATEIKFEYKATLGFENKTYQELMLGGTSPSAAADPTAFDFEISATNGVAFGSGKRAVEFILENCVGTFKEVTKVGSLTFIDIAGSGTFKSCVSYDNIATGSW